jgi:hypothetical protein
MFRSSPDYAGLFYKTSDTSLYAGTYNGTTIAFGSTGVPVTTGKWYLIGRIVPVIPGLLMSM